jgi:site-specific recombinase XerD
MTAEIIPAKEPHALAGLAATLPALFVPDDKTAERFFGFFTAEIRNPYTRRAYYKAACRFNDWCEGGGLPGLAAAKALHVAAYIEGLQGELAKPSVKQHLAALRMLFDWMVVGHALDVNPAHALRGPKYSVKKGKTPVLDREEARALIESIDTGTLTGLRDRALIATMVYTFARVSAVLQMNGRDYFTQGRRGWMRFHEKGGKEHEAPCHHKLEAYMDEYIAAAGIADDADGVLWLTTGRATGVLHRMGQKDAYTMIERRARQAGIRTKIGNHSWRATGVTDYLKSGGTLEKAQGMANHSSPRTIKLYDRRNDETSLDEYERVGFEGWLTGFLRLMRSILNRLAACWGIPSGALAVRKSRTCCKTCAWRTFRPT